METNEFLMPFIIYLCGAVCLCVIYNYNKFFLCFKTDPIEGDIDLPGILPFGHHDHSGVCQLSEFVLWLSQNVNNTSKF